MSWIKLPGNVRVADVASVLGRLLGCEGRRSPLGGGSWAADVAGVSVRGIETMPECARILIEARGEYLFHFEDPRGRRLLRIDADTREGRALAVALVEFFGGVLEDDHGETLHRAEPGSAERNHPEDGAPWDAFQARILEVQPVNARARRRAAKAG